MSPSDRASGSQPAARRVRLLRRDARLANVNAALWAVGNGLTSSLLITYLALALGAEGLVVSGVLAAPRFVGVLRLGAPALIARLQARKGVCLACYALSGLTLALLPALAAPGRLGSAAAGLAALVVCWCVYQVLEYVGTVALWSWLGDLFPPSVRGRLIGRRERWLVNGQIIGMFVSYGVVETWNYTHANEPSWVALSVSATLGAVMIMLAVVPLARMSALAARPSAMPRAPWRSLLACLREPGFGALVFWSVCLSIANGITGAAQGLYPNRVLGLQYTHILPLRGLMRAGQSAVAPAAGGWVDAVGSRRVMLVSQLTVAVSPLFFLAATPAAPWWIAGAYVVWIAYAGLNVGLDSMKLNLAPATNNAPALAVLHAASSFANGVTVLFGGWFFMQVDTADDDVWGLYAAVFLAGFVARSVVGALVLTLRDSKGAR